MKASKFNVFFVHEGYNVGFNSYSKEYTILEDMLYQMYDASLKAADFSELLEVRPDFYQHLVDKNFLVESSLDEVALVKELSYQIDNDESLFELHINPTMNCNFKCWYCYETHIKDSKMDEATISNTQKFIQSVFDQKPNLKQFQLGWFGGEPLLYFNKVMVPILKSTSELASARKIKFTSSMTSNGLLVDRNVIEKCKLYGLNFFQITLDGNRQKHNKVRFISEERGSYDKIVSNIFDLARNELTVLIRINISVETLEGLHDIADDFAVLENEYRQYIKFDLHKVWQVKQDIDREIQQERLYYRQQGYIVVSGTFDTVINSCYGDHKNHATLNYNGEAFKCTARDFTIENSEGKLSQDGIISWNSKYEKRMSSKFKNPPCLECRILPMCGGGCSQQAIEHEGVDYCVYDFDEDKKVELIRNQFIEILDEVE